jgi:hypothetical protein
MADEDSKPLHEFDETTLVADVEQFLHFHRSADLTAEVLEVRLLLAIFKLLKAALPVPDR